MRRFGCAVLLLGLTAQVAAGQVPGRGGWRLPERPAVEEGPEPLEWGVPAAAHLLRRAGFSAGLDELDRVVRQGFDATVDELVDFEAVDDSAMEAALDAKGYEFVRTNREGQVLPNGLGMQQWWYFRMLNSRRQLVEKMTLFWHDHFATSLGVVRFVNGSGKPLMQVQNETLREHALGNFREMVLAIARDPAMIVWLNNFENVKGRPNENWARELLELFTMGEGNGYTEQDIQEAARAFTGWSLLRPRRDGAAGALDFVFRPQAHDEGPKTFLGQTIQSPRGAEGIQDGERVVEIIFEQPQVAEYVAHKVWEYFVYPEPEDEVILPLAKAFRDSGYELKALMRALLEHPHFLSEKAYRAKIKSPVELAVGAYRELGITQPENLPRVLEFYSLGQTLFFPPDVGGWTSDTGWINTGTILARFNLFAFMISNDGLIYVPGRDEPVRNPIEDQIDVLGLLEKYQARTPSAALDLFAETMVQGDLSTDSRYTLETYLATRANGDPLDWAAEYELGWDGEVPYKVGGLIYLLALLPAYQLN